MKFLVTGVTLLLLMGTQVVWGQSNPPSLQAGLGGISFDKGNLDTEVIAKLIADKQNELKVMLIQEMLLRNLNAAGGTVSAYVNNVIETTLSSGKPEVQTKSILENTANMAVALAFINHYVGVLPADSEERANLNKLAISLGYLLPSNYKELPAPTSLIEWIKNPIYNARKATSKDGNGRRRFSETQGEEVYIKLAAYLLDITAEVLRNNEVLKERGLFRFADSELYRSENRFLNLDDNNQGFSERSFLRSYITLSDHVDAAIKADNKIDSLKSVIAGFTEQTTEALIDSTQAKLKIWQSALKDAEKGIRDSKEINAAATKQYAKDVYEDIEGYVNTYVSSFGVFDFIVRNGLSIENIDMTFKNQIDTLISKINIGGYEISIDDLDFKKYKEIVNELTIMLKEIPTEKRREYEELFEELEQLFLKMELEGNSIKDYEYVYLIGNKLLPAVRSVSELAGKPTPIISSLERLELSFVSSSVEKLVHHIDSTANELIGEVPEHKRKAFTSFYHLFGSIQKLDDIESYEKFVKSFYSTIDVFTDGKLKVSLERIINLTTDHIEFVKTDSADYLTVDVEGVLATLSDFKSDRWRPFSLYLTVGGNTFYTLGGDQSNGADSFSSFQYFGEKIGVKLKLADYAYLRSFSKGETFRYWGIDYERNARPSRPVVSDIHWLFYTSGLLYNLAGTSSDDSFNSTIVGTGPGISFFNGLDFNVTLGLPVGISDPKPFLNIGFDIRFTEYLQALGKK